MHGLCADLKLGLKTLLGRPAFSLVVILALGIGIGANTAMFSLLNAALIQPLPFPEPDRLVLGYTHFGDGSGLGFMSAPDYFDCRDEADAFESLAAMLAWGTKSTITGGERPERVDSTVVSHDLFPTLGVNPALGRGFTSGDARPGAPPVVVVSHGLWQDRLGGSPEAIGSALTVDGRPYTVVGVMPARFHIRSATDIWMPMVDDAAAHLPRRMHNWYAVGRLRPGVTLEQARAQADVIAQRLAEQYPDSNRNKRLGLTSLHEAFVRGDRASLLRAALITGQVALSIVLLVCAGLLIRSLVRLHAVELGFRPEGLLTAEIELPYARYPDAAPRAAFATTLLDRARALPGVESAGLINLLPVREPRNNVRVWAAHAPPTEVTDSNVTFIRGVLPGYFESMGIPLLAGRDIRDSDDAGAAEVVVINESLARALFPDRTALGREVIIDYPGSEATPVRVVGIVGDVHLSGPGSPVRGVSYASYRQRQTDTEFQLALRAAGDPEDLAGSLRALVQELDPEIPLSEVATMEHFIGRGLSDHRTVATLVSVFAVVAMLLASLGLYGMLTFYVGQRTREIGVRMALGAAARELLTMVVQRGMKLVLIGLVLGIAGAWVAARLLDHLLFGVPPTDPVTLLASAAVFAAVGLLACLLPAWRATRIDPAISLSAE